MTGDDPAVSIPRVFVSYSWSSPNHQAWVLALAEKLTGHGVHVILDKWDLAPGQDGYAFMERMVTDPTVTKVLMISDRAYAAKADSRTGGVGVEAQIISPQLYRANSANQTRFAAACLEYDSSGEAYVPTFYRGRIHFDFSRHDTADDAYERVLRWAFDRPLDVRPALGSMPASLAGGSELPAPAVRAGGASPEAIDQAEAFRRERLVEISDRRTPSPLSAGAVAVLHLAPLPAFADREAFDIVTLVNRGTHMPVPLAGRGGMASMSLLGACNTLGEEGYGLLLRNGAYEGTHVLSVHDGAPYVASIAFGKMVVGAVRRALALQESYAFSFPSAVMLSFCDAADVSLRRPTEFGGGFYENGPLGQAIVEIPRVIVSGADADVPTVLRPLLNATWNAFGLAGCDMYDGQGHWTGDA
jgi:TIR domain